MRRFTRGGPKHLTYRAIEESSSPNEDTVEQHGEMVALGGR